MVDRTTQPPPSPHTAKFPGLKELELAGDELRALETQGFVSAEKRRGRMYYKLRFRVDGKQRVRYLGGIQAAQAVEAELKVLQRSVRARRQLAVLRRAATQQLRAAKQALQPFLDACGFHFHGQAVRKRRAACGLICRSNKPIDGELQSCPIPTN